MLKICEEYGIDYHVTFNPFKTHCIVFSKMKNIKSDNVCITLNINILDWKDKVTHLGTTLTSNLKDDVDTSIKRGAFIASVNNLMAHLGSMNSKIITSLFQHYCCSLYGSQIWNLKENNLSCLYACYNKSLRKIWHLSSQSH